MKSLSFFFYFLFQDIFLVPATGIVYYVKPSSSNATNCPGQPCETLQYYFEYVDKTINQQTNATMIFMPGTHYYSVNVNIIVPVIYMKGESQGVVLNGSGISMYFSNFTDVYLSDISIISIVSKLCTLRIKNTNTLWMSKFMMTSVMLSHCNLLVMHTTNTNFSFNSCKFYDGFISFDMDRASVTMENCSLSTTSSFLSISQLVGTNQSLAKITNMPILMMLSVKLYLSPVTITSECTAGSFRFDLCEFQDGSLTIDGDKASVNMENCNLTNSSLSVRHVFTFFSGISLLSGTNQTSAISSYFSNITLSGDVIFANNCGIRGGAIALYSSTLNMAPGTNVFFVNNSAVETGGAIYINPSRAPNNLLLITEQAIFQHTIEILPQCFYQLLNCSADASYTFSFANNTAMRGGDDIYGASLQYHQSSGNCTLTVNINNSGISSVSSDAVRVCLCDSEGIPQCKDNLTKNYAVCPGEMLNVSAVIVGGDFGATTGSVFADFLSFDHPSLPRLTSASQYIQAIDVTRCSNLTYSIHGYDQNDTIMMYLTITYIPITSTLGTWKCKSDEICLYTTPVYLSITQLPCPIGFTLLGEPPICDCYPILTNNNVECDITNGRGVFSWTGSQWLSIDKDSVVYDQYCPFDYCNAKKLRIDLLVKADLDSQCAFNRVGKLCGGCKKGYSLAIGSSRCIYCPNNNSLALLIFFAAAGFLLVFFISVFNLTVTQGMINGLIFYANIVWAHQGLLFPQQSETNANALTLIAIGKAFIAWLNLDFGIQMCFFDGLNAFWKTWLQYLFPFYTAGLFFIGLRYSSKLAKLFGSRSVPTLATLLFLSYTKLLRTIITSLELSRLTNYPNMSSYYVWSVDGNLKYGQFSHITLLFMAIGCLLILWLPYTLLLFLMQWLRRLPNLMIAMWITRYKPVIDAYFAPLKDKHHYWFGVLLLSRGILLLMSSLTANISPAISPFLLHGVAILLLCYMNYWQVYRNKSVLILESAFLINLIILTGGAMYYNDSSSSKKDILVCISIGIAFIKFCGIIIWSMLQVFPSCLRCQPHKAQYENIEPDESTQLFQEREIIQDDDQFRHSVQNDSQVVPTY